MSINGTLSNALDLYLIRTIIVLLDIKIEQRTQRALETKSLEALAFVCLLYAPTTRRTEM
jgi:hypothetical protein